MQEHNISRNNFEQCIKCDICTSFCPVIKVLPVYPGPKHGGPDGERLRLKNKLFFDENLDFCLNCKRCEVVCPSGVKIADIIHAAREKYGETSPKLRDRIMANTDFVGRMAVPFAGIINPVSGTKVARAAMDAVLKIDHRRILPEYSHQRFETWFSKEAAREQDRFDRKVCYFHGCYVNYNYPQLGKDLVRLMNAFGYGVELLEDEKCCGVAMMSSGMFGKARKNAADNLRSIRKTVREGRTVLTTSTTCAFTMRNEYPDVLGLDNCDVREDIMLALRFIYEKIESRDIRIAWRKDFHARTAYHVPCHMEKLGWSIFTVALMDMIPGMEMIRLDSNCCGIAGTYGFKKEKYDVSQSIGEPLFRQIEEIRPDYVVSECETCKWQIEMSTAFKVKNPVSILAEAVDIPETTRLNGVK